jgi:hypothetical protein
MIQPITEPGEYPDIPAPEYHADPCPRPSLSASLATVLAQSTPRHAMLQHARLNPDHEPENRQTFDLGDAFHTLMLGKGARLRMIKAPDYRTKAAQAKRDRAYEIGRTPMLEHQWHATKAMVRAARAQLAQTDDAAELFQPGGGRSETTLVWQEGDVWCRCRIDRLSNQGYLFADLKSTDGTANPEEYGRRQFFDHGHHIKAAFYRRGLKAVLGIENAQPLFVVVERKPPYGLAVMAPDPEALALGEMEVERALRTFGWCLHNDFWPGYDRRTHHVSPPPWHANKIEDRKVREQLTRESEGKSLLELGIEFHRPIEKEKA